MSHAGFFAGALSSAGGPVTRLLPPSSAWISINHHYYLIAFSLTSDSVEF
jgi:hypothetical protein